MRTARSGIDFIWRPKPVIPEEAAAPDGSPDHVPIPSQDLLDQIERAIAPWKTATTRPPFNMGQIIAMMLLLGGPCRRLEIMARIVQHFAYYAHWAAVRGMGSPDDMEELEESEEHGWLIYQEEWAGVVLTRPNEDFNLAMKQFNLPVKIFRHEEKAYYWVPSSEARIYLQPVLHPDKPVTNKSSPLLDLPVEIREEIYNMVLQLPQSGIEVLAPAFGYPARLRTFSRDDTHNDILSAEHPPTEYLTLPPPKSQLSILLANRQTYNEAMSIFYRHNNFLFPGLDSLSYALNALAPSRREHIEHLSFKWDYPRHFYPSGATIELAESIFKTLREMPYLRRLDIRMDESDWTSFKPRHNLHLPLQISDIPGFTVLEGLRGLEVVNFYGECENVKETLMTKLLQPKSVGTDGPQPQLVAQLPESKKRGKKRKAAVGGEKEVNIDAPRKTRSMARAAQKTDAQAAK